MKYWLYYNIGACNDGDHDYGLESFQTLVEVQDRIIELKKRDYMGGYYTIIRGEEVPWP